MGLIPQIAVVTVSFNSAHCLRECLCRALVKDERFEIAAIVVDNASSDASAHVVRELATEGLPVRLSQNSTNVGFSRACNEGARATAGDYLLFLNPDCFLEPGALGLTVTTLARHPEAAAAGGLVLNLDGSVQRSCRRNMPDPARSFYRLSGLSRLAPKRFADFDVRDRELPLTEEVVEAVSGSYLMIRRADFEALGGWDEGYFLHCEDLDLCQRIRDLGRTILFVPGARAIHLQGESTRRSPVRTEWHKHRGMWRFYRKFQARRYGVLTSALVIAGVTLHFFVRAGASLLRLRTR